MASDNNNIYLIQLTSLLQNSTLLLHQLPSNVIDWSSIVSSSTNPSYGQEAEDVSGNTGGGEERQDDDEDSEEESSDDDENMFLGGGYSSSEDDDEPSPNTPFATPKNNSSNANDNNVAVIKDSIEYINEEISTLLKRANCVHSALLLSLPPPPPQPTSTVSGIEGSDEQGSEGGRRKFVKQLIADILSSSGEDNELARTMAYLTSSKVINNNPIKSTISNERWKKVCLTNGLLVVQYLIHLLNQPSSEGSSSINGGGDSASGGNGESVNKGGSALDEWNVVILPLLFGNLSLFLVNDDLRDALLGISSFSSSTSSDDTTAADKCQAIINICQTTLQNAISSTSKEDRELRQTYILVICQVLICLYDGISSSSLQSKLTSSSEELLEIVQNGIHSTILTIIRGICYATTDNNDTTYSSSSSQQQLTLEALRPVTGMLLPKLYNDTTTNKSNGKDNISGGKDEVDGRAIELWNEILKLLGPYSEEQKCCKNWNQVAPMTVTSILCIVLPAFRKMELPTTSPDYSSTSSNHCRPIFQPSLWNLIRNCLSRCGDSNKLDGGGGRGTSLLSRTAQGGELDGEYDRASMDQLLRRRSAHALRLMVEYERECLLRNGSGKGKKNKKKGGDKEEKKDTRHQVDMWMKYILCFEMLEMETELHLVEQVWETVKEITSDVASSNDDGLASHQEEHKLPRLVWDDISSLLCRILLSEAPTMRKLGLYRFLSGNAGVDVTNLSSGSDDDNTSTSHDDKDKSTVFMRQPQSKGKIKKTTSGQLVQSAPLSLVSVDFVLDVVLHAYDSLVGTKVGLNMQVEEGGKMESASCSNLLESFLSSYTTTLTSGWGDRLSKFVNRIFGPDLLQNYKSRSLVLCYRSVATSIDTTASSGSVVLDIDAVNIQSMVRAMRAVFSSGGAPKATQEVMRLCLALVLKNATAWEKVDASIVLQVLAMYPPPEVLDESEDSAQSKSRAALGQWVRGLGNGMWAQNAASACASAYVLGQLHSFGTNDVISGVNSVEREIGMSVCILCSLSGNGSELLWPAVFKGLQNAPSSSSLSSTPGFCKANRSMILLEYGCKEGLLSGMGNGDLILDKSKEFMMPPPPHIESLLTNAIQFILGQLVSVESTLFQMNGGGGSSGGTRSSTSNNASSYIATLIGQVQVLHRAYPSSNALSQAVDSMLDDCTKSLSSIDKADDTGSTHIVKFLTLSYAALSCGATFNISEGKLNHLITTCQTILELKLSTPARIKKDAKQACRSIFQYAKWGSLSLLVPMIMEEEEGHNSEVEDLYQGILDSALSSVDATPVIALPPLFECALGCGKHIVKFEGQPSLLSSLQTIIDTLFAVLKETSLSAEWSYMLNAICTLIFNPKLLLEEYQSSYVNNNNGPMPIKTAFEKLLKIGGTSKPHIIKNVVSRISVAWLGPEDQAESNVGLCAIPYRERLVDLLIYKECKFDETSAHLSEGETYDLPETVDDSSITRAFVLSFLSKLPSPQAMSGVVLAELVRFIIAKLLDICCTEPAKGKVNITGSETYQEMTRSWQALCLLSRFVTEDIASDVATRVFSSMSFTMHGEVRYFIEVFTIQCTRMHPSIFGGKLIQEIHRSNLSLQHVSSLMIIAGNLTAGRYAHDFFTSTTDPKIKEILCGALPWLGSTQGFSRAIAQLLCHKLIPLVVNVDIDTSSIGQEKDDAILSSVYTFLDGNKDMTRAREKQQRFFDAYDVDKVCSFEGLLSIPVDEGEEANPMHMIDAIKEVLAEVYKEAHEEDSPVWAQMEKLLLDADDSNQSEEADDFVENESELVNFQRKILPIDALYIGIRSVQEQKHFNAAGKKKQNLIVCASLIDKVPNLAGLARTCEIFSAQSLIMPNLLVKKQDDFKSISASANDWIEMEECKESELLSWLHQKKAEGYAIVGLEQTASSKCLTKMKFPDKTVLLLGKEKEGIPIEFLSAVDQCIEIPQLGIIRSLNVHVSGAISIWEYTKQMLEQKK